MNSVPSLTSIATKIVVSPLVVEKVPPGVVSDSNVTWSVKPATTVVVDLCLSLFVVVVATVSGKGVTCTLVDLGVSDDDSATVELGVCSVKPVFVVFTEWVTDG